MLERLARLVACCLVLAWPAVAAPAVSVTLLGTVGQGRDGSTLVEIDPATGALVRTIGPVGYTVNGLAYDATTGALYGTVAHRDRVKPDVLLTIDMATGAGTPVSPGNGLWTSLLTANSKGELFAWSAGPVLTSRLVKFDKAAGTAADVGGSGIPAARHSLAFDANDVLYLLTPVLYADADPVLFTLDPATAAPTELGPVPGLPIYFAHHGTFNPADNLLYALDATEDYADIAHLVVIDPATRSILSSVETVYELHTLTFVTPSPVPPPVRVAAASRKVHGSAGTFDVALPAAPAGPGIEPRVAAPGGGHTVVLTFDKDVTAGSAVVSAGTGHAGTPTFNGREMTVPLTGVADGGYVTLLYWGVVAADRGVGGNGSVRVGFLEGDVNASGVVSLSDLLSVNAQLAQEVTAANFRNDVDASGALSLADVLTVNSRLAQALPPP